MSAMASDVSRKSFNCFFIEMVRNYIRKTDRACVPEAHILQAVRQVLISKEKIADVSLSMSIPRRTLSRYCSKASKLSSLEDMTSISEFAGYKTPQQVINFNQYIIYHM